KGTAALVTGASRGFGRGIAAALSGAGAAVVGVARDGAALGELRAELGESFTPVSADAADPTVAGQLIDAYRPGILVLNAGAPPLSPATELGAAAVAAYAAREGMDVAAYLERSGPALTPGQAGEAFVAIASDPGHAAGPYLLTAAGLSPVP